MHSIVRIDEVTKEGIGKISEAKGNVAPFPMPAFYTKGPIRISLMHPTYHSLRTPDKVVFAASDGSQTITYARLEAESNQTAHLLRDLGLNQGDGIAILLDNDPRLIVAWAAQRSGLYYTPISTFFKLPRWTTFCPTLTPRSYLRKEPCSSD